MRISAGLTGVILRLRGWSVEFNRYYTKIKPLLVIFMLLCLIVAAQQLTQKKTMDTRGVKLLGCCMMQV